MRSRGAAMSNRPANAPVAIASLVVEVSWSRSTASLLAAVPPDVGLAMTTVGPDERFVNTHPSYFAVVLLSVEKRLSKGDD